MLNLAQTLANAFVKVVIPTERYFSLNFILFLVKKLNLGYGINLMGNLPLEKHWLTMCKWSRHEWRRAEWRSERRTGVEMVGGEEMHT